MNDDEIFFIADLGENPTILINGKEEPIPRYVVWNKPAAKMVEKSDDLPFLLEKYGLSMLHVLKYKPFL